MSNQKQFKGKVALVTGSSRGIGKATALELAQRGANVVVNYLRKSSKAEEVVSQIQKLGQESIAIKANVAKREKVEQMFARIKEEFGTLDLLINNASMAAFRDLEGLDEKSLNFSVSINMGGPIWCAQQAGLLMEKTGGSIVNVITIGIEKMFVESLDYVATKTGLTGITRYLAKELAPKINVCGISPGLVETDSLAKLRQNPKFQKQLELLNHYDWIEVACPKEIAKIIAFLCTREARFIKGHVIDASGGMLLI